MKNGRVTGVMDFENIRFGVTDIDFKKNYRDHLSYNGVRTLPNLKKLLMFYQFTDAFNNIG